MIRIQIRGVIAATLFCCVSLQVLATPDASPAKSGVTPEGIAFFERRIRPVLVDECHQCHSAKAKRLEAGLYLDSRAGILRGGDQGPAIAPGKPDESLLVRALAYLSSDLEMPPDGKLDDDVVRDFRTWVEIGAPWPDERTHAAAPRSEAYDWQRARDHWAFRPIEDPPARAVTASDWPANDLDTFILARLESAGLRPSPRTDRRTLLRRVYFDLVGLPPPGDEVTAFLGDDRDDALARVVDRLLASPHYGERWARHWLDVARYSDGFGSGFDGKDHPAGFRYRDWVVGALNRDLPYDRFVVEQIAGDLVGEPVATGFLVLGPTYQSDGGDAESRAKAEADTLEDRVDTTLRGFLGLTVACARCHDHKFDPIPTADYYSVAAVFRNTKTTDHPAAAPAVVARYEDHQSRIRESDQTLKTRTKEAKEKHKDAVPDDVKRELDELRRKHEELKKSAPPKYPVVHGAADSGDKDMHIALRGDLRKRGELVPRRFLRILTAREREEWKTGSGRLELGRAIADPNNPLTARVIANRIWIHHFGRGIVRSPSNFGTLGETPTHPQLLDWLASRLVASGWSVKELHRTILLSATYAMSSTYREEAFALDGDNRLLWRMNPRRLEVEAWRDAVLAATGELERSLYGTPTRDLLGSPRRTLYTVISRNGDRFESDRFLRLFDFPAARITSPQRVISTVPQQYLFLLNSPFMFARAQKLAERITSDEASDEDRVRKAFRILFGREPEPSELALAFEFIGGGHAETNRDAEDAVDPTDNARRWSQYAQVLLSSHEFWHVE